jgi:hypothetical protein
MASTTTTATDSIYPTPKNDMALRLRFFEVFDDEEVEDSKGVVLLFEKHQEGFLLNGVYHKQKSLVPLIKAHHHLMGAWGSWGVGESLRLPISTYSALLGETWNWTWTEELIHTNHPGYFYLCERVEEFLKLKL